jgi:hypothetical protein
VDKPQGTYAVALGYYAVKDGTGRIVERRQREPLRIEREFSAIAHSFTRDCLLLLPRESLGFPFADVGHQ